MNCFFKNILVLTAIALCFNKFTQAQTPSVFTTYEDTLKVIGKQILYGKTDKEKYAANELFKTFLEEALAQRSSFDYPFDSLKTIARLVSPDKKFRIFNWNLPLSDGTFEYFGYIQLGKGKRYSGTLYPLIDRSAFISSPETEILTDTNWYGAHYYKLFSIKIKWKRYYMLLGWDGNNLRTNKKIIEVLTFDDLGNPTFGADIFNLNKKEKKTNPVRIFFEYAKNATISLKYENHYVEFGKHKTWMIVFDRIFPLDPNLEGQYEFYIPETNIFDAFIIKKRKWTFVEDVDARNSKEFDKNTPTERPPQKDIYAPIK